MSEQKQFNPTDIIIEDYKIFKQSYEIDAGFPITAESAISNAVSFKFNKHKEKKKIKLDYEIVISAEPDDSDKKASFQIKISFMYNLEKIQESYETATDDGKLLIDIGMASTLIGIGYSTTRGLIVSFLQGTYFDGYLLPVIDIRNLIDAHNEKIGLVD